MQISLYMLVLVIISANFCVEIFVNATFGYYFYKAETLLLLLIRSALI